MFGSVGILFRVVKENYATLKLKEEIIVFILPCRSTLKDKQITASSKHTWHLALLFGICPVYRVHKLNKALSSSGVCVCACVSMNAMCGVFLPHMIHQSAASKWLQTRLVDSVPRNNIHLVKIDIREARIKRNLTLDIKVSFCSTRGGASGLGNRREGRGRVRARRRLRTEEGRKDTERLKGWRASIRDKKKWWIKEGEARVWWGGKMKQEKKVVEAERWWEERGQQAGKMLKGLRKVKKHIVQKGDSKWETLIKWFDFKLLTMSVYSLILCSVLKEKSFFPAVGRMILSVALI